MWSMDSRIQIKLQIVIYPEHPKCSFSHHTHTFMLSKTKCLVYTRLLIFEMCTKWHIAKCLKCIFWGCRSLSHLSQCNVQEQGFYIGVKQKSKQFKHYHHDILTEPHIHLYLTHTHCLRSSNNFKGLGELMWPYFHVIHEICQA